MNIPCLLPRLGRALRRGIVSTLAFAALIGLAAAFDEEAPLVEDLDGAAVRILDDDIAAEPDAPSVQKRDEPRR